jgi:hypothetical protein
MQHEQTAYDRLEKMLISDTKIENSWNEISSSPDSAIEKFHEKQPIISEFLVEALSGLSQEAGDLGFFATLVVWRAYDLSDAASEPVTSDTMTEKYHAACAWIQKLAEGEDSVLLEKKLRDVRSYSQPHVMRYVIEAILDSHEDGLELSPDELERLFVCLKAIVDALDQLV